MKLIDTLTSNEIEQLLNGNAVGFFPYMLLNDDVLFNLLPELCLTYYTERSAEKTISPVYDRLIALNKTKSNELIGRIIRSKFNDKWSRIFRALVEDEYNVLHNDDYTEQKTANNVDTTTYDTVNKKEASNTDAITYDNVTDKSAANTDTITYDVVTGDETKTGKDEVTTRNILDNNEVYGFNSSIAVGDNISTETTSETVQSDFNKNISVTTETKTGTEETGYEVDESTHKSGTDTHSFDVNESQYHTGTDTKNYSIDESVRRSGRNVPASELISKELSLRNKYTLFDIILRDVDTIAVLNIYI